MNQDYTNADLPTPETAAYARRSSRLALYALAGVVLSLGAPLGLALVDLLWRAPERWPTYLYVGVSTLVAFAVFGAVLGRQADRLAQLSENDRTTGLLRPDVFHNRLMEELTRAERYHLPLSLIVLGVPHAPSVPGKKRTERLLASAASVLGAGSRGPDIGGRLGSERLGLIVPCTSALDACALAARLRVLVHGVVGGRPEDIHVGVASAGPGTVGTAHALMDAALRSMEPEIAVPRAEEVLSAH